MKWRRPGMLRLETEYSVAPWEMVSLSVFNNPSLANFCNRGHEGGAFS